MQEGTLTLDIDRFEILTLVIVLFEILPLEIDPKTAYRLDLLYFRVSKDIIF